MRESRNDAPRLSDEAERSGNLSVFTLNCIGSTIQAGKSFQYLSNVC